MGWYERLGRWSDEHRFGVDLAATLVVAAVVVPAAAAAPVEMVVGPSPGWAAIWAALLLAPLPWRRVRPVASAVAVFVVALAHMLTGLLVVLPADFAVLVALFSVTVYGPRWAHRTAIVASLLGAFALGVGLGLQAGNSADMAIMVFFSTAFGGTLFLAVWAFGLLRRSRRETLDALRDRARRLEIERDQQAQIATAAERSRIAREMHDIVAHSLSVIIAQADGGRYAATADPEAATRALSTVSDTGRAALADMRRLLGVLRSGGDGPGAAEDGAGAPRAPAPAGEADRSPQPASGDLESLVAQVRASGLRVSLVRIGTARQLPPGAGLTVYRVCQEALTNVLKHAGPDPAVTVVVRWKVDTLHLEVDDDGRGASARAESSPGFGLLGMRERAAIFGGTITAGPRPGGGFRVRFTMPIPPAPPRGPAAVADDGGSGMMSTPPARQEP
ncbi:sensor histidine kinase [Oerskovia flava]|uniref:sensor histidine kinase n=1 Tax=Oerskovia flava TaxID=2986422 RepID=UPI0022407710|nr:sensor histidine kinase [Oerskovia sp. JB1-3-2]